MWLTGVLVNNMSLTALMDSHHLDHRRKLETYILSVYDVDTDVHWFM